MILCPHTAQNSQIPGDTGKAGEVWEGGSLSQWCGALLWVMEMLWNEIVVLL